jgi:hypothetical protein
LERKRKERVESTSYVFMSLDPRLSITATHFFTAFCSFSADLTSIWGRGWPREPDARLTVRSGAGWRRGLRRAGRCRPGPFGLVGGGVIGYTAGPWHRA